MIDLLQAWKRGAISREIITRICEENNCKITFHKNGDVSISKIEAKP